MHHIRAGHLKPHYAAVRVVIGMDGNPYPEGVE
ncbi:hypothetical protein LCGC14_1852310, partial [marine sediment metagenome]